MSQYDNTNSGALFKNDKKSTEKQPDYKGNINVNGVEFWISSWIKTPKNGGNKFMSISVTPKDEDGAKPAYQAPQATSSFETAPSAADSDIPF